MHWTNLALILVAGSQLTLGIVVLLKNLKSKINFYFSLSIFALAAWTFVTALFRLAPDIGSASIFYQLKLSFGLLIALFFEVFTLFFPYQKGKINLAGQLLVVIPAVAALAVIIFYPQYAVNRIALEPGFNQIIINKIFWILFSSSFTLSLFVAFARLFIRLKEAAGFMKSQIVYVIIGGLVPVLFAWFFNIVFLFFDIFVYDWLGAFLSCIFALTLYYFIFYYQLKR